MIVQFLEMKYDQGAGAVGNRRHYRITQREGKRDFPPNEDLVRLWEETPSHFNCLVVKARIEKTKSVIVSLPADTSEKTRTEYLNRLASAMDGNVS